MEIKAEVTVYVTGERLGDLITELVDQEGGATVLYGRGIWNGPSGRVDEPSAVVVIVGDTDRPPVIAATVHRWIETLDERKSQDAALVTVRYVEAEAPSRTLRT